MEKNKEYYEALDKRTNEFKDWKKSQSIEPHIPVYEIKLEDEDSGVDFVSFVDVPPHGVPFKTFSNEAETVDTTDKWEGIANEVTQANLQAKHEANPTIDSTIGAGDVVEKITTVTGIKAIVKAFTPEGEDCGCDKRKEKMNELPILSRKKSVKCLTVEEYNFMDGLNLFNNGKVSGKDVKSLQVIYQRVFNVKGVSSCAGCSFAKKLDELKAVLETYK